MAKRKTRYRTKKSEESIENLVRRSELHMTTGRYKDAIEGYKRLLKKEPIDKWRELLAQAYLARAQSLAGKAMYQEALVMWENRAHLGFEGEFGAYIYWLLCAGRHEKALNQYQVRKDQLERADITRIEAFLASHLLARGASHVEGLDKESPVILQYRQVEAVIAAYCQNDDNKVASLLQAIPYRSPYRDFRAVFSALLLLPDQPQDALEMLDRLATDSPFQGFAKIVRIAASGDTGKLHNLGQASKGFIAGIKGIDPQQLPLLNKLNRDANSPNALFGHLLGSSKSIDKKTLQPLCLSLLAAYPAGIKQYSQHFEPLSDFAVNRIRALAAEQRDDDLEDAVEYWRAAYNALTKKPRHNQNDDQRHLKMALILRHSAELYEKSYGNNTEEIEDPLLLSLKVDPDDKPTHLKLLGFYQKFEEKDDYRKMLDRAVNQFPDDTEILLMAVELAIQRNTFKKAARLAAKILEKDPINMRVRTLLIEAHLAHARKQMLNKRFDLADKEIEAAQAMERSGFESGLVDLYRGLLAHKRGNPAEGETHTAQACSYMGCDRLGYFRFIIEAGQVRLSPRELKPYQKLLKQTAEEPPLKSDVMALVRVIQRYPDAQQKTMDPALVPLNGYFKKAAHLTYTRDEMERICETWQKTANFPHLQTYAKRAKQTWPEEPAFIYYEVYASSGGGSRRLKPSESGTLMRAMELLRESGNPRLIEPIVELLGPFSFMQMLGRGLGFDDEDEDEDEDDDGFPFIPF